MSRPGRLPAASERRGNNLKRLKNLHLRNGASQGQNLAVTVLYLPSQGHNLALTASYMPHSLVAPDQGASSLCLRQVD